MRLYQYFNLKYLENKKKNSKIYGALLKHRHSNFSLEILEYCGPSELLIREKEYFDLLNPEYNILKEPGNCLGRKHSEKTKKEMSDSRKGENHSMYGKTHSEESKLQNSLSNPNRIRIEVTDLELNTIITYNSIGQASRTLNI
jgi:group I intron endonuclease